MISIDNIIPSKKNIVSIGIFLFGLTLIDPLKNKFDNWLIMPWLSQVRTTLLNDVIFLVSILFVFIFTINQIQKKNKIGTDIVLVNLFVFILYLFCRINNSYQLYSFSFLSHLKYADLCLVITSSVLVIKIVNLFQKNSPPKYFENPFIIDIPIEEIGGDLLNRLTFAKRIAEKIQSKPLVDNSGALAIGITGEWGSGKSSFKNLIKNSLEKENRIIIEFNPWRSSSPEKIIEDFFELLIDRLKVFDQKLSANIYSYAKTLTTIDENIYAKSVQALSEIFEAPNKNEIYDSINESIEKINKQIIIFIDDLDRLDSKEITEVLRIIRNTANFNNVVYVVAYDRMYMLEAVKSFNQFNYRAFLEKIFQFEFALPLYNPEIIQSHLLTLLNSQLPEFLHKEVEWVIKSTAYKGINFTTELIQNHRTTIRLANALIFEIKEVVHDVFFYDFYLLQLFKLKYPQVFNLLFDNNRIFFIAERKDNDIFNRLRNEDERSIDTNMLQFKNLSKFLVGNNKTNDPSIENKNLLFNNFLDDKSNGLELSEYDIYLIKGIVEELVNPDRDVNKTNKNDRYKIFARTENYYKYFAFDLMHGEIPAKDFEFARRLPYNEYQKSILNWLNNGKSQQFINRIYTIESFMNRIEFENQVRALFEVGRTFHRKHNFYEFNNSFLFKILELPKLFTKNTEISIYPEDNSYKEFLISILGDSTGPRTFDNQVMGYMVDPSARYPLDQKEAEDIMLKNFIQYTNEDHPIDSSFWLLYNSTLIWNANTYKKEKNPKATEIMIEYYKSHIYACDLGRFISQTSQGISKYYLNEGNRHVAFKDINDFEDWFKTAPQLEKTSNCYQEFIKYYEANKPDFPNDTAWIFKHLIPNTK